MPVPAIILTLLLIVAGPARGGELPAALQGLGLRESPVASRDIPGWQTPDRVVVRSLFGPESVQQLAAALPGVEVIGVGSVDEAVAAMPGTQVLVGFCRQEIFDAAGSLHWVQVFFAGVENCVPLPAMQSGKLVLTNGQRLGSPTLADHSIALMYGLARELDSSMRSQVKERWESSWGAPLPAMGEVDGKTMLVVGLGGIGTQVAKRAHGLGMRVIATRGSRREGPDYVDYVGLAHEAIELAAQADVVVNAAPLTASTTGMFDAAFFKAMKPSAYFISVGRGKSTVTEDLVAALKAGDIAGAGLDVTDPEPLPDGHALWSMPGVIITPHVAGRSMEAGQRLFALVAENLRRYAAGEPLLSVVNIKKGY
jgi:phosphoglycerate dehydrogenase-like enzyme